MAAPLKKCSCGKEFKEVPKSAKFFSDEDCNTGYYWDCECNHTTLFYPTKTPIELEKKRCA